MLEDREVPSGWLVTSSSNSSATSGSLPWAVAQANADTTDANIAFSPTAFPSATVITLATHLNLSNTSHSITIDGSGAGPISLSGGNSVEIFTSTGTATIRNLTMTNGKLNNSSGLGGGAIDNTGTLTIDNDNFVGNTVSGIGPGGVSLEGGAICNQGGNLTVLNSTFSNNSASGSLGGAIMNSWRSGGTTLFMATATIENCLFVNNSADLGGAVFNDRSLMSFENSTFTGNSGGAIRNFRLNYGGIVSIQNCTITNNGTTSPTSSGGITNFGIMNLANSIVASNTASAYPDAYNDTQSGATVTASYSLIGNATGSSITAANGNILAPAFVGLGALGYYDGPTLTIPLIASSPGLGAANAFASLSGPVLDTTTTSFSVTDPSQFFIADLPNRTPGTYFTIQADAEQMTATAVTRFGGYQVGDVLMVVGGTHTLAATLTVTSVQNGFVTGVNLTSGGTYTVIPPSPVSVTGGHGTGATFVINPGGGGSNNGNHFTSLANILTGGDVVSETLTVSRGANGTTAAAHASAAAVYLVSDQRGLDAPYANPAAVNMGASQQVGVLPAVTALSPARGTVHGGTTVVITGSGFSGATAVRFGGTAAASFVVNSDTQITAISPAGAGVADVTVGDAAGTSLASNQDQFNYAPDPFVAGVSPPAGPVAGGTSVVITGSGFTGASAVKFGATNATSFVVNSDTQITAISPAGTSTVDVSVTATVGTSINWSDDHFSYTSGPIITALSSSTGPVLGGTSVIITGFGFSGATAVNFGATNATSFVVDSPTQITAVSPAGTGSVDVTVASPTGTSFTGSFDLFSYIPAPAITSVAPNFGILAGGVPVTITGSAFTTASAVSFGAIPASSFVVNSPTQITAITPPEADGTVDITVSSASGTSTVSANDRFTYDNTSIVVTTASDAVTHSGISLRDAIAIANRDVGDGQSDTITFSPGLNGQTITLAQGLLSLQAPAGSFNSGVITIIGNGQITIDGNNTSSIFQLYNNSILNGLTIQHANGAAVIAGSMTTLINCTLQNNANSNAFGADGDAIENNGVMTVVNCTITGNAAIAASDSGAVYSDNKMTLINTTIAGNSSNGIAQSNNITVINSTISGNGAGLYDNQASPVPVVSLTNSIFVNNGTQDIFSGGLTTNYDMIGVGGGSTGTGNIVHPANSGLGALGSNGGLVRTIPLLGSSPALGAGGAVAPLTNFITSLSASFTVANGTRFAAASMLPLASGYYIIQIDQEQMLVTDVTLDISGVGTFAVVRGVDGTTPTTHAAGSLIYLVSDARGAVLPSSGPPAVNMGAVNSAAISSPSQPTVTSVSPNAGMLSGGTSVTITGANFTGATAVSFGGSAATSFTVNSDSQITAIAPIGTGTVDVTVTTPNGGASATTLADQFSYLPAPAVTSVVINGGPPAYTTSTGRPTSLAGQNSIVEQILVTFNEPVTLDAGAFTIANDYALITAYGGSILPSTAAVTLNAPILVAGSNGTQYILTFQAGPGTTVISSGTGVIIDNGVYMLNTDGSKVHAAGQTAADNHTGFWALYGSVAADNVLSANFGDGNSEIFIDTPDAAKFKNTLGSNSSNPAVYDVAMDANLDGTVDSSDTVIFKGNFGADWVF